MKLNFIFDERIDMKECIPAEKIRQMIEDVLSRAAQSATEPTYESVIQRLFQDNTEQENEYRKPENSSADVIRSFRALEDLGNGSTETFINDAVNEFAPFSKLKDIDSAS